MTTTTDRIEKQINLRAPRARVWRALSDAHEFGQWFGAKLEGQFEPGARLLGRITHPGYEHLTMELMVEQVDPGRMLSFRWHPYAVDPKVDYSAEPTTLVVFELADDGDGTKLKVVESGFDRIPESRRAEAFRMNDQGWSGQLESIERHVSTPQT